jgi:hypothetical protein
MRKKNQPSLESLFAATRADLMELLSRHAILHVQAETMLREITSRMRHYDIDNRIEVGESNKLSIMNEMSRKARVVDEKLRLLVEEHNELFDSVVAFNTLVLNSPRKLEHLFIQFDEIMAKIFADQYERFGRPYKQRKVTTLVPLHGSSKWL